MRLFLALLAVFYYAAAGYEQWLSGAFLPIAPKAETLLFWGFFAVVFYRLYDLEAK